MPKLDSLEKNLPTLESLEYATPLIEAVETFLPRLRTLDSILVKIEALNATIQRLETLPTQVVQVVEKKVTVPLPVEQMHEWNRLKKLAKFTQMVGKAEQIEKEWQRIEQDENDELFSFQVLRGRDEVKYMYKKGIADGVRWCVERFC